MKRWCGQASAGAGNPMQGAHALEPIRQEAVGFGARRPARRWVATMLAWGVCGWASVYPVAGAAAARRFDADSPQEARQWQRESRSTLQRLMFGGAVREPGQVSGSRLRTERERAGGYRLEEVRVSGGAGREAHAWLAMPAEPVGSVPAVLALHGHGGSGEDVVQGRGLYGYGRVLAEMGYAVLAPDIGSHELQRTNWTLMGERVWDALGCMDYLAARPEVDSNRLAVVGLSLGGEVAMYVAALDERVKLTVCSGWLTTLANLKDGHCPCWDFPGLEETFEMADLFACIAPRDLLCEIGAQEKAPGGFPAAAARETYDRLQVVYDRFGAGQRLRLDVHGGGHVFRGAEAWDPLRRILGAPFPYGAPTRSVTPSGGWMDEAARRGELARRCFSRAVRVADAWWARRDPGTSLFPRRLEQPIWAPQDNAADMLPFLFTTARMLQGPERERELAEALRSEKTLTTRAEGLPDWYALDRRGWVHPEPDLNRAIFGAAEYCKDGLVPMTEWMGRGPWTDRMMELMASIWAQASVMTEGGPIPSDDSEVNGDILQALARLQGLTGDRQYLEWASRIVEAYIGEVLPRSGWLPPHRWDFVQRQVRDDRLNLNDHGNELLGGLAEWQALAGVVDPERARRWREPLGRMFHRLVEVGRNEDGLWYNLIRASTGEVLERRTPDTWGYGLSATLTFGRATDDEELIEVVREALRNVDQPRYLDWEGADSYADAIEGALLLLNRLPTRQCRSWLEKMLPLFLGRQRSDGIVEGWYGDGNFARTALMAGHYYTQGVRCRPWREDLRWGAVPEGGHMRVLVESKSPWEGVVLFDTPRHRDPMGLPHNPPRLNELPEWFTVEPNRVYRVRVGTAAVAPLSGASLRDGLPVSLGPKRPLAIELVAAAER